MKSTKTDNKKGVIWVSTVIYTLIGLSVIALLLAVVRPRLAEMKDSFTVRQTIDALNELDSSIIEIQQVTGNTRLYELYLSRGEFTIDSSKDSFEWYLDDCYYKFSEPDTPVQVGNIWAITTKQELGDRFEVKLRLEYGNLDITFDGIDETKLLQPAKTQYRLWLENKGIKNEKINIDITLS